MLNFRLGATGMGWSPGWWRCSVLLHWLQGAWAGWGISEPWVGLLWMVLQSQMIWEVRASILPQVNDHLLQERCHSGGIQRDSSHSRSCQQLSTFFLMKVCFCTVNDLCDRDFKWIALTMHAYFEHKLKIRNLWNKLTNIQNIMCSGGCVT